MQNSLHHPTRSFGGWPPCSPLAAPGYTSGFHNFLPTFVEILPDRLGPEVIVGRLTRPDHLKFLNGSLLGRSTPISPIRPISPSQKCRNSSLLVQSAISRPLYDHDPKPVTLTQPHHHAPIINVKAHPPLSECPMSRVEYRVANPWERRPPAGLRPAQCRVSGVETNPFAPRPSSQLNVLLSESPIRVIRVIRGPTRHPPN